MRQLKQNKFISYDFSYLFVFASYDETSLLIWCELFNSYIYFYYSYLLSDIFVFLIDNCLFFEKLVVEYFKTNFLAFFLFYCFRNTRNIYWQLWRILNGWDYNLGNFA